VPYFVAFKWSWYFHVPTVLNFIEKVPPGATSQFVNTPAKQVPASGYPVCVGCIADAGHMSRVLLFLNMTVVPLLTVRTLGE
jgi:hypothetical protein